MLRAIFGEMRREDHGRLKETNHAMKSYCLQLRKQHDCEAGVDGKWIRLELWTNGLYNALNELEQSIYCCNSYGSKITKSFEEEMLDDERDDYYRYIYYYKNALVRIFSILDKSGYFLDTLYDLHTGQIKERFSYFTVLRNMHKSKRFTELEQRLFEIKVKHQHPLNRLRNKRNLEIHSMNVELIDDIWRARSCFADKHYVESIQENLDDLDHGMTMVCDSLYTIFTYCTKSTTN